MDVINKVTSTNLVVQNAMEAAKRRGQAKKLEPQQIRRIVANAIAWAKAHPAKISPDADIGKRMQEFSKCVLRKMGEVQQGDRNQPTAS